MSHGCGTLCSPSAFNRGTLAASSSNGKQHGLPKHPAHRLPDTEAIEAHWNAAQPKGPTRLWGPHKTSKYGGVERPDGEPELWLKGEYWNVDSNIRIWGEHEVRRNGASGSHDVHRHDQITRIVLPPQPGTKQQPRQCVSGVVGADTCFLEAWGFDLGLRDRQARPATLWRPVNKGEMFRDKRSYNRNISRLTDNFRTLRQSATTPGLIMPAGVTTLRPEDVGGEAGDLASHEDGQLDRMGRTYGSRSCHYWDTYDHTCKREAAKMSCSIHSPSYTSHSQEPHTGSSNKTTAYPIKELDLNPASVYTLKYKKWGEDCLRKHVTPSQKADRTTARGKYTTRVGLQSTL